MNLFREVMIWKRLSDTSAVRYCCLNDVVSNKYAVQNADFFRLPLEDGQFRYFERQFVELFIEVAARDRCDWFDSPEEAIIMHDKEFY